MAASGLDHPGVLLTGVGTRLLDQVLSTRYPADRFAEALRGLTVVARGSKPMAVLRELNVPWGEAPALQCASPALCACAHRLRTFQRKPLESR